MAKSKGSGNKIKKKVKAKKTSEKKSSKTKNVDVKSVVAKSDDGTVQITFTLDKKLVKKELKNTAKKLAETLEVKGFRKGKAPVEKVMESVDRNELIQNTLNRIVPKTLDDAFKKHNLKPVMFPKVELLKADEDSDWQLRAITAELPDIDLGDYKKIIKDKAKTDKIWTPDQAKKGTEEEKKDKEMSQAEKEQEVMKILLENIKFEAPKVLIEDEVNARLAKLLDQIDKLGLNLENYLKSVGKDAEKLREEYRSQAEETLRLEFILNKIAEEENIKVNDSELDPYLKQLEKSKDLDEQNKAQQITYIRTALRKRKTLEMLLNLISG
jgi:trigger factor